MLGRQFPEVGAMLRDAGDDLLAFSAFPEAHWRKLWSTNPLDRLHREVKRRCDVVGVFPNDAAIDRLVTAVIVEQHDEWQVVGARSPRRNSVQKAASSLSPTAQPSTSRSPTAEMPVATTTAQDTT